MTWPNVLEYDGAVQTPKQCFSDPELKAGQITLTHIGLPKVISGSFASVYQIRCGACKYAVRCFLKESSDCQKRYHAISEHLRRTKLPYMVAFEFIPDGILIGKSWYPILKMEWIEGDPLPVFIKQNLGKKAVLYSLASQWIEMLVSLRRAEIAHGDLQHGNILVRNGQIKLIDYDGLYVPGLSMFPSRELGHRNYQHPARSEKDFGPYLDDFPGWVILTSLSALAMEPGLWRKLGKDENGTTESLLFDHEDFTQPNQSNAFRTMINSQLPEIRSIGSYLQSLLSLPLVQIPPVSMNIPPGFLPQPVSRTGLPAWLKHNQQEQAITELPPLPADPYTFQTSENTGADWLVDHLSENVPVHSIWQNDRLLIERGVLLLGASMYFHFAIIGIAVTVPLWLYLFVFLLIIGVQAKYLSIRYSTSPCHADGELARAQVDFTHVEIADIERELQELQSEVAQLNEPLEKLSARYRTIPEQYHVAIQKTTQNFESEMARQDQRAKKIDDDERTRPTG